MNAFDLCILHFLNSFAHRFLTMDAVIVFVMNDNFLRGGFLMALFWSAWIRQDDARPEKREYLIFGLLACFFSVLLARVLALQLPFRERPLRNPGIVLNLPYTMDPGALKGWSSFPSDHATLFFCLATALWMVSRRLGIVAVCHALFVVTLPRVYAGIHYPTDILAGALLGCGVASLARFANFRKWVANPVLRVVEQYPAFSYTCFFLLSFEFAEMFATVFNMSYSWRLAQTTLESLR